MQANASDILNGLLGVTSQTGTGQPSQPAGLGVSEGSAIFSDILGLLTNPSAAENGANQILGADAKSPHENSFESTLSKELGGPIMSVWMLGRPGAVAGQPFTNSKADDQPAPTGAAGQSPDLGRPDCRKGIVDLLADSDTSTVVKGATAPIPSHYMSNAMDSSAVELASGKYRILAAGVTDDSLNLTLESADRKQIQVTLPLEQLLSGGSDLLNGGKASGTGAAANIGRIPLNQNVGPVHELTSWFDRLNLSELRVEMIKTAGDGASLPSLKFSFVDPSGAGVLSPDATFSGAQPLEVVLPSAEIRAFRLQNLSVRRGITLSKSIDSQTAAYGEQPALPVQARVGARVSLDLPRPFIKVSLPDAEIGTAPLGSSSDQGFSSAAGFTSQGIDLKSAQTFSGGDKVQYAPVRFTLPETIDQTLTPNGRSISLKIQPEHLGPARLSLHYNSEGLTARVTVDSPLAQNAIERSLDRLHDQLTQAGVKVDRLEVALSGGFTRDHSFHQQPQWRSSHAAQYQSQSLDYRAVEVAPLGSATPLRREYLSSQGVNLFA